MTTITVRIPATRDLAAPTAPGAAATDQVTRAGTVPDTAAAARSARFGRLPARVRYEELVAERPATPTDAARRAYNEESAWLHYSCLAVDLGL
jgi:hypothetical protein